MAIALISCILSLASMLLKCLIVLSKVSKALSVADPGGVGGGGGVEGFH